LIRGGNHLTSAHHDRPGTDRRSCRAVLLFWAGRPAAIVATCSLNDCHSIARHPAFGVVVDHNIHRSTLCLLARYTLPYRRARLVPATSAIHDLHHRKHDRNLDQLDKSDQLLFRLLAATGMRLSEAFEINGEMKERGCRYVIVGHKTPQSHRRVPLPAAVLPYLPKVIHVPLFAGGAPAASKRLNKFIRRIGVVDKGKVVHSLRHRAQDRLRAAGCPVDYRWALLGHEMETVAEGYGLGFPVPMLKKWIDRIGF
jgi:integrase